MGSVDYNVEIRKIICSANAIESLNAHYRRAVRASGRDTSWSAGEFTRSPSCANAGLARGRQGMVKFASIVHRCFVQMRGAEDVRIPGWTRNGFRRR